MPVVLYPSVPSALKPYLKFEAPNTQYIEKPEWPAQKNYFGRARRYFAAATVGGGVTTDARMRIIPSLLLIR
jgi:hypothetical protein